MFLLHNGPPAVLLLWMSRLVLLRRPGNVSGRVLLTIGLLCAAHVAVAGVTDARLVASGMAGRVTDPDLIPAQLPLDATVPLWIMSWLWVPAPVLAVTTLLLIFPDGRLPSPRWRPAIAATALGGGLLVAATAIDAWPTATWTTDAPPLIVTLLLSAGAMAVLSASLAGLAAMVMRWRQAVGRQRYPFQLVGIAGGCFALTAVATYPWQQIWVPTSLGAFYALLVVYALAVARYRLHDLEPFIGKALVVAIASIAAVVGYAAVVLGIGILMSRHSGDVLLPLLTVTIGALGIEPLRRLARRAVERALFGRHADRTDVISRLAARTVGSSTATAVLADGTELLVRSTGAARAEAWLELGGHRELVAATGTEQLPQPVLVASITHRGRTMGQLKLFAHASVDLAPDAAVVLTDVANLVGVAVRNELLSTELQARLEQLQALSRRLVEAHDTARRGLERDLHDGVQARLLSIRLRIGALYTGASALDPHQLADALGTLISEVDSTVAAIRDVARGLHPPILQRSGLAPALTVHCEGLGIPITVETHGLGRYEQTVENAVYFSCMEAVQNAVKHAGAKHVAVRVAADEGAVRFTVADDGAGFDPSTRSGGSGLANIGDRVTALGGRMTIDSAPGRGTRINGMVPAQSSNADR
jgi:two-component system, NarL family, sensor kinase